MAEILKFNNEKEWCYECECGCSEFYALTSEPKDRLFIGFRCIECEKIIEFKEMFK